MRSSETLHPSLRRIGLKICIGTRNVNDQVLPKNWPRILRRRQFGSIVPGVFTPVLAKHSKSFSLIDCISVGVDRMQRNFEPMRKQVEAWQRSELTDVNAKVVIYEAFVEVTYVLLTPFRLLPA